MSDGKSKWNMPQKRLIFNKRPDKNKIRPQPEIIG
jgi:hypothetical protein